MIFERCRRSIDDALERIVSLLLLSTSKRALLIVFLFAMIRSLFSAHVLPLEHLPLTASLLRSFLLISNSNLFLSHLSTMHHLDIH